MTNRRVACPICRKTLDWSVNVHRPFCSERCRLIDLGKWASEEYRVAGEKKDLPEGEQEEKKRTEE